MPRSWFQPLFLFLLTVVPVARPAVGAEVAGAPSPVATQELVFGNGTPGPFPLSWTAVRIGSERLSVNGAPLRLGLDYLLDYDTGAINFLQPLRRDQIAQVEYVYDGSRAKPNHAPAQVPLAMSVWGGESGGVQMIGAVRPAATPGGTPSATLLGFRGETTLSGGKISSLFLLSPEAGNSSHGSTWETAALRFGASRTEGPFRFSGSVAQAGADFTPAKEHQLQQGLRVLDFSAAFDPSKRVSFTSQVKRQEALDAATKSKEQESVTNQLTLSPSDGTKLTLTQESVTRARAQGKDETRDALRARIEQQLGDRTKATAAAERQHTDAAGTTTTTQVALETQAATQLRLRTDLSRRDSEKEGRADTLGLGFNAGREQGVALEGGFVQKQAERTGTDTTSNLRLSMRPAEQLGLRIGYHQRLTEAAPGSSPVSSPTGRSALQATDWGVTAGRSGLLKVEGKTVEKVAASGPGEQEEQLRVETSPLRGVKVATLRATKQLGEEEARDTRETSLELSPTRELQVAGALREQELADGVARVRSVSGSVKPGGYLDLSGAYKTRETPTGDALITRDVRVAVMPVRGLKLQGSYAENPEDKSGRVLDTTQTSVGLESTIGSLGLAGSYTTGEASAAVRETELAEFRLSLDLWGNSRFYSAYRESEERAGSMTEGRTISLGFTRSLGQNLYLLLEGELTQVRVDGVAQPGLGDQRAQAKLGLRF
jgi:hypothetical protein